MEEEKSRHIDNNDHLEKSQFFSKLYLRTSIVIADILGSDFIKFLDIQNFYTM